MYSSVEKHWLLALARESIGFSLKDRRLYKVDPEGLTPGLRERRACFVTLTMAGRLRGCIGNLEAIQPLYSDVIENSVKAAFGDSRFPPLGDDELERVRIELSVLEKPVALDYKNADDLVRKLRLGRDGIILRGGDCRATFLPQVWDQLKTPEDFLSRLCLKAGLDPREWKKGDLELKTYKVEAFDEGEISKLAG